jgi:hypothetical protein
MKDWMYALALSAVAILLPIKPLLMAVGFLITMDTITGIWAAKKRGEKISSAKLRSTVSKAFIYQLCVISGFIVGKYIIDDILPVAKLVAGAIATVELKSILENSNYILGVNVFDALKQKLGSLNLPKE